MTTHSMSCSTTCHSAFVARCGWPRASTPPAACISSGPATTSTAGSSWSSCAPRASKTSSSPPTSTSSCPTTPPTAPTSSRGLAVAVKAPHLGPAALHAGVLFVHSRLSCTHMQWPVCLFQGLRHRHHRARRGLAVRERALRVHVRPDPAPGGHGLLREPEEPRARQHSGRADVRLRVPGRAEGVRGNLEREHPGVRGRALSLQGVWCLERSQV
jgi:hypothetical protein